MTNASCNVVNTGGFTRATDSIQDLAVALILAGRVDNRVDKTYRVTGRLLIQFVIDFIVRLG